MSDFLNDDFTAELKTYFLENLVHEVEKFADLIDGQTWKRIHAELAEQTKAWAIDAKTNEFPQLTQWLESYAEVTADFSSQSDVENSLERLKLYLEDLKNLKTDSLLLGNKYALIQGRQKRHSFLHCKWEQNDFAIPLLKVIEIAAHLPVIPLPDPKANLSGVIPFRGDAVPVLDWSYFGMVRKIEKSFFFIVCEVNNSLLALPVTDTEDIVSLLEKEIVPFESNDYMIGNSVVRNFFVKDDRSIMILDIEKMVA